MAEKLAEKKLQNRVRFASNDAISATSGRRDAADAASSEKANDALKKQFKKMKKERKKNDKVASGLADGRDKAFASLGGSNVTPTRQIGDDDDYDFGVL